MLSSKWKNLSRSYAKLIHVCKKTTTHTGLQGKQELSVKM